MNINGDTYYNKIKTVLACLICAYFVGFIPMAVFYSNAYSYPIANFPVGVPWYHLLITWPLMGGCLTVIIVITLGIFAAFSLMDAITSEIDSHFGYRRF